MVIAYSMVFTSGADPWHFGVDPDPDPRTHASDWIRIRILLFSSLTFKTPTKNYFFKGFSAYYFLKVHLHNFSKLKKSKRSPKTLGIKVFLTIFA
jgi:hypothetical protein